MKALIDCCKGFAGMFTAETDNSAYVDIGGDDFFNQSGTGMSGNSAVVSAQQGNEESNGRYDTDEKEF